MKRTLGDAIDNMEKLITENYSPREKELYALAQTLRLKLRNLEDDVMSMYKPDWFRCECCNTVTYHEHLSDLYKDSNTKICALCAPEID